MENTHKPVLLTEIINLLKIKKNGIYVDCTLGRAGHSSSILKRIPDGKLFCFEQDQDAINESIEKLKSIGNNFEIIKSNFKNIEAQLALWKIKHVDGIIYDLGVSSPQLDQGDRGFSYNKDSRLDMRMDQTQKLDAFKVVNDYTISDLIHIFKIYGQEKFAYQIAKNIINYRAINKISTTFELVDIIKKALPQKVLKQKGHPARKIFQAIRIEVNDELNSLKKSLIQALNLLNKNGILIVVSFHSLEDNIVKKIFKNNIESPYKEINKKIPIEIKWDTKFELVNKKVVIPSISEINENNRARSAKLRAIIRK